MRTIEYDIKNESAIDAVCNAIKHSASIYDFQSAMQNFNFLNY